MLISDQTRKTEPTNIYLEQWFVTVSVYEKINGLFYFDILRRWHDFDYRHNACR